LWLGTVLRRGEVLEELRDTRRTDPSIEQGKDSHGSCAAFHPRREDIADVNVSGRPHLLAIDPNVAGTAGLGGLCSCLVQADRPQPFVEAQRLAHRFLRQSYQRGTAR
jgi:hypothetical protein